MLLAAYQLSNRVSIPANDFLSSLLFWTRISKTISFHACQRHLPVWISHKWWHCETSRIAVFSDLDSFC